MTSSSECLPYLASGVGERSALGDFQGLDRRRAAFALDDGHGSDLGACDQVCVDGCDGRERCESVFGFLSKLKFDDCGRRARHFEANAEGTPSPHHLSSIHSQRLPTPSLPLPPPKPKTRRPLAQPPHISAKDVQPRMRPVRVPLRRDDMLMPAVRVALIEALLLTIVLRARRHDRRERGSRESALFSLSRCGRRSATLRAALWLGAWSPERRVVCEGQWAVRRQRSLCPVFWS